jgi:hypothetical protein
VIRKRLGLMAAMIGISAALLGALQSIDRMRVVDILMLFFGGFGAGAGLVKAVLDYRQRKTNTNSVGRSF